MNSNSNFLEQIIERQITYNPFQKSFKHWSQIQLSKDKKYKLTFYPQFQTILCNSIKLNWQTLPQKIVGDILSQLFPSQNSIHHLINSFIKRRIFACLKNAQQFSAVLICSSCLYILQIMKTILLLACLLLLTSVLAAPTTNKLPQTGSRSSQNIYPFVDHQLRQKYWYYLTKAILIYRAEVEKGDTYQFLAIYRNIVGTFLAITTWKNQSTTVQVNTLVRLGNGYEKGSGANYSPVDLKALRLKYLLGDGEYLIDIDNDGDVAVNGKTLSNDLQQNLSVETHHDSEEELVAKCKQFSDYAKTKFWYYLEKSDVVYSTVSQTNKRNYCMITYLNLVGTFLVLGSYDSTTPIVNTFVRLGNGFEKDSGANYEPVSFNKITLQLRDYEK